MYMCYIMRTNGAHRSVNTLMSTYVHTYSTYLHSVRAYVHMYIYIVYIRMYVRA